MCHPHNQWPSPHPYKQVRWSTSSCRCRGGTAAADASEHRAQSFKPGGDGEVVWVWGAQDLGKVLPDVQYRCMCLCRASRVLVICAAGICWALVHCPFLEQGATSPCNLDCCAAARRTSPRWWPTASAGPMPWPPSARPGGWVVCGAFLQIEGPGFCLPSLNLLLIVVLL